MHKPIHRLFSTIDTNNGESTSAETRTEKPNYSSYTPAQILLAQEEAEEYARTIHDSYRQFAMNALFVNIPERPEPIPCAMSSKSPTSSLPSDLPRGCLLRIGPNGASKKDGFLDGDGIVHCITLPPINSDHKITYSATYVDTKGRQLERSKNNGKTFGGTLGAAPLGLPMLSNLFKNGITFGTFDVQKDTCNTALAVSGDRLLALMEQSPPSEISITKNGNMETVQSFTRLDGAVPYAPINGGSFSAHGRTDPITKERIHVSYSSSSKPYVRVDTFNENWKLKSSVGIDVPTPIMVHDCAITSNFVVLFDFPLTIRPIKMLLENSFPVEYEPQNGSRVGLLPRNSKDSEVVWFEVESGVVLHAANAYEREDGTVVVHAFKSIPSGDASYILEYTPSYLYEWVLDPTTGETISERCLNPDTMVEFPQINDDFTGQKASSVYALVCSSIGGPLVQFATPESVILLDSVIKFALEDDLNYNTGDVISRYDLPSGWHFVSEPTVVSKTNSEGNYVLLIATYVPPNDDYNNDHVKVATDGKHMKTQLLIFDGDDENMSNGPLTIVDLPHHVNYGLHSEFLDWNKMK